MQSNQVEMYPRFSDDEIARRHDLVRSFIEARGLDGLVVFGWSARLHSFPLELIRAG